MADFLLVLADFDQKHLWRDLGHASLFSFLRRELGLSAGAAQYRKTAAELLQRFPEVEAALREGHLCLSSVIELAKPRSGRGWWRSRGRSRPRSARIPITSPRT